MAQLEKYNPYRFFSFYSTAVFKLNQLEKRVCKLIRVKIRPVLVVAARNINAVAGQDEMLCCSHDP